MNDEIVFKINKIIEDIKLIKLEQEVIRIKNSN